MNKKLSPLEEFMEDPVNPNIYGSLENVKRSYKATIDMDGDGSGIFCC